MLALLLFVEGLVVCFIVLLSCVVGIQNGAQGLIFLYEKDVQERAIANGLVTRGFKAIYPQKDNAQKVGGQHYRLSAFGSDPVRHYVTVCEIKGIEKGE